MRNSLPVFVVGVVLGGLGVWAAAGGSMGTSGGATSQAAIPQLAVVRCDRDELERASTRVAQLERELATERAARIEFSKGGGTAPLMDEGSGQNGEDAKRVEEDEALTWRVSAIEKFVPLTADQKEQLTRKYRAEREAKTSGSEARSQSLEQILGEDNARYYRQQVNAAFKRMQDEEMEKDVLLISRQLSLDAAQEESVRAVFAKVEEVVEANKGVGKDESAHDRVKTMIEENRQRSELRNREMQNILSSEQYKAYLKTQTESSAADVEVFHAPAQ